MFHKTRAQQIVVEKELLSKELELLKNQQADWKQFREESINNAKAVMFETSREVSKELLDNHKRENESAKKNAEEITKKETEALHKEFKSVVEMVNAMKGQTQNHDKRLTAIWQSLANPVKASNFAEIGLENTLKLFDLRAGVDYVMQGAIDGSRLRPDAIINLPSGNLMLIDAKTSKYFIEIAAATDGNDTEVLKEKLKNSMNTHLKQLTERDYVAAAKSSKSGDIIVTNVMYLPNEGAYARVLECDKEFATRCHNSNVLLITPIGLHMLLSQATHHIVRERQERNFVEIKKQMGRVISSVDVLLRGLHKVGKSIRDAAESYSELSKPGNRLIGRIKLVQEMGLEPENQLKLPNSLPNFNIAENEATIVEMESEPSDNLRTLEKKAG